MKYPCPCCHHNTHDQEDSAWEMCPVCHWENDPPTLVDPLFVGGANSTSLIQARKNYLDFGACDIYSMHSVRTPTKEEIKDTEQEKNFNIGISLINNLEPTNLIPAILTTWRNMDDGIEKFRSIRLVVGKDTYKIHKTYEGFEDLFIDLQNHLPQHHQIETCFFCRFSCYHPVGNDNFGELDCFKHCKQEFVAADNKHKLLDLYEAEHGTYKKVEEPHYCNEFQAYKKGDWIYKKVIK
jgi:Cysteine-rich CPCC